ncbi:MAG: hypothetical protein ACLRS2_21340 [[Clostridium] innocuum]
MLDPQAYTATMDQLNQRFDYVLLQICTAYFLYESIGLILFRQTVGRRLYHKKVYLNFESRYDLVLRIAILPVRTLVKLLLRGMGVSGHIDWCSLYAGEKR